MNREKVFVGMSGGVDSSVAALRLIKRGYNVVGVFIKVWQPDFIHCDWEKERLDAMRVAAHLGISFLTFDAEIAYKKEVADYMIHAYETGYTPNPDVMCNEHVKFGAFFDWAKANGADKVATGHYARIAERDGIFHLLRGTDSSKDQSYFLWRIHASLFPSILFPVGDSVKTEIRKEAKDALIPIFDKADSQGVCFLGEINMKDFLAHYIPLNEGDVLDEWGSIIGTHSGALLYTLGERHGFTTSIKSAGSKAQYVIDRNLEKNTITVASHPPTLTKGARIQLADTNALGIGLVGSTVAQFRYRQTPVRVAITVGENHSAILSTAETAVTIPMRGQSCVLYRGDECCGGGIIS
jgi:tRNA-specific 2-thiouridylase